MPVTLYLYRTRSAWDRLAQPTQRVPAGPGPVFDAVLEGDQITLTNSGGWVVRGLIEGGTLEGVVTKPASTTADGACDLPGETTPIIWSTIDIEQKELSIKFMQSAYQYRWKDDGWGNRICDGISFQSKSEESIALTHL